MSAQRMRLHAAAPSSDLRISLVRNFSDSTDAVDAMLRAVLQRQPAAPEVVLQGLQGSSLALGADFVVSTTAAPRLSLFCPQRHDRASSTLPLQPPAQLLLARPCENRIA